MVLALGVDDMASNIEAWRTLPKTETRIIGFKLEGHQQTGTYHC